MSLQIVKLTDPIQFTNVAGGLVPRGAYNAGTDYAVGDSVDYNGSSYVMHTDAGAGTLPTDTTKWQVLANKGDTGAAGADGADSTAPGPAGADGLTVSVNSITQVAGDISLTQDNIPDGTTNKAYTATEQSKLSGIEAGADVTDATNVAAAGAIMDGDITGNGLMTRTAVGAYTNRTITGTANQVTVTNGDGVAGNPTLALPQDIHTGASPTFARLNLNGTAYLDGATAGAVKVTGTLYTNGRASIGGIVPVTRLHLSDGSASGLGATPQNRGMGITGANGYARIYYECVGSTSGQRVFVMNNEGGYWSIGSLSDNASSWVTENILRLRYDGAITTKGSVSGATDSTYSLGTPSLYWKETYTDKLFLNSTATLDGSTAGTVAITGNVTSTGTGSFTTVTAGTTTDVLGTALTVLRNNVSVGRIDNNASGLRVQAQAGTLQLRGTGNTGIAIGSTGKATFASDIEFSDTASGVILKSPDGTLYRVTVANGGTLTVTAA